MTKRQDSGQKKKPEQKTEHLKNYIKAEKTYYRG